MKNWLMRWPLVLSSWILLNACSIMNQESFYEGIRSQQKANSAGKESKQQTLPSYQQYEIERGTLKNNQ